MTPPEAYQFFETLRRHFKTDGFDFLRYNYNSVRGSDIPQGRKYLYSKMSDRWPISEEFKMAVASLFARNKINTDYDFVNKESELKVHLDSQQKVMSAPHYHVHRQLKRLCESLNTMEDLTFANVLGMSIREELSCESIIIADKSFGLLSMIKWDENNPASESFKKNMHKYKCLVHVSTMRELSDIRMQAFKVFRDVPVK